MRSNVAPPASTQRRCFLKERQKVHATLPNGETKSAPQRSRRHLTARLRSLSCVKVHSRCRGCGDCGGGWSFVDGRALAFHVDVALSNAMLGDIHSFFFDIRRDSCKATHLHDAE